MRLDVSSRMVGGDGVDSYSVVVPPPALAVSLLGIYPSRCMVTVSIIHLPLTLISSPV